MILKIGYHVKIFCILISHRFFHCLWPGLRNWYLQISWITKRRLFLLCLWFLKNTLIFDSTQSRVLANTRSFRLRAKKELGSRLPSLSFPWTRVRITWAYLWSRGFQDLFPSYTPLILTWANRVSGQGMRPQKMKSVIMVYGLVQCTSLATAFSVGSWTTVQ